MDRPGQTETGSRKAGHVMNHVIVYMPITRMRSKYQCEIVVNRTSPSDKIQASCESQAEEPERVNPGSITEAWFAKPRPTPSAHILPCSGRLFIMVAHTERVLRCVQKQIYAATWRMNAEAFAFVDSASGDASSIECRPKTSSSLGSEVYNRSSHRIADIPS